MDQTENYKNISGGKKPRKKHVGLWVSLTIFVFIPLFVVGAGIGTLHYFFYDSTLPPQPTVKSGYNEQQITEIIKAVGIDSIDNTKTNKQIQLNLSTDDMNNIIVGKLEQMFKENPLQLPGGIDINFIKQFISGFGLRTDNDKCSFEIGAKLPLFKTRAIIDTSLTKTSEGISFNITDTRIGKVKGLADKIKSLPFVGDLIDDSKIQSVFSTLPITLTSDLKNNRILYEPENMYTDLCKFLHSDSVDIFSNILHELFNQDIYNMHFVNTTDWNGMSAYIDLENLGEKSYSTGEIGEKYFDITKSQNLIDWTQYKQIAVDALNKGIVSIETNNDDLKAFYDYVIRGYDKCLNKDFIDGLGDLSSIGINNKHAYKGIYSSTPTEGKILDDGKSIKDIVVDQISSSVISLGSTISVISETHLNDMLRKSEAFGNTFILQRDLSKGTSDPSNYKISTFTVDNIYSNVYSNNSIDLTITISVNGYPIYLYLSCTEGLYDSTAQKITFKIKNDDMYFGKYKASASFEQAIYKIIDQALKTAGVVTVDSASRTLILDLASAIEESGKGPLISLLGGTELVMTGSSMADEGTISIKIPN